jgi:hypothetical protein
MKVHFPQNPHQQLLFVFLMMDNLTELRWYLSVILVCISLIGKHVEYLFMFYYQFMLLFMENMFNSFAHLLIGLFVLLLFNFLSILCILDINLLNSC